MARDLFQYVVGHTVDGVYNPLSGIRVTVTLVDDTPVSIYQSDTGSTQGPRPGSGASGGPNPFITGNSGAIEFYVNAPEAYKITIEDTIAPARIPAQNFVWTAQSAEDNSFPGVKIVDLSVTTAKINDQAITAGKVNNALKPSAGAAAGTESLRALGTSASTAAAGNDARFTKVIRTGQSIVIAGGIFVPSGSVDVIPPFFVPILAPQVVKLIAVKHKIGTGTSVTWKLQKNGSDLTGFTGISTTTTAATTDPADQTLADGDQLQMVVTAVSGGPKNFSATLILEHSGF